MVVARLATFKMETEEDFDATRWIDRTLIRRATFYPLALCCSCSPFKQVLTAEHTLIRAISHIPRTSCTNYSNPHSNR